MSKVHPEDSSKDEAGPLPVPRSQQLTVWKRSSMSFQGSDGFTVFDQHGNLAFRVDNYSRRRSGLLLMDGSGRALLTLKPQKLLSIQHEWTAYRGDSLQRAVFSMRRPSISFPRKRRSTCEADMFLAGEAGGPHLKAHGSFRMRNCNITTTAATAQLVATISRKRINSTLLLTDDVFTLKVLPGFQPDLVMAFVIILDRISYNSYYAPILCS